MRYVVAVISNGMTDFIADGRNYTVNGESFVPFVGRIAEAKKYKTRKFAERASNRNGANMYGEIEIIEVESEG